MCDFCKSSECVQHPLVCQKDKGVDSYFKEQKQMKDLRERCEKLYRTVAEETGGDICDSDNLCGVCKITVSRIEAFASEIRNEVLEEAAKLFDGTDLVHMHVAASIRALAAKTEGET